ncbi:MAG: hypothetical protein SFZ03_04330 [Candidatus Melainabacteria bacterium]|nr:hypothetical protein [Candidatus Melainabacteria bacterium]
MSIRVQQCIRAGRSRLCLLCLVGMLLVGLWGVFPLKATAQNASAETPPALPYSGWVLRMPGYFLKSDLKDTFQDEALWYGVFAHGDGYQLARVSLEMKEPSPVLSGRFTRRRYPNRTAWLQAFPLQPAAVNQTHQVEQPLFLIHSSRELREGPVLTVHAGRLFVFPGQSHNLSLGTGSACCQLYAKGSVEELSEIQHYRLYLISGALAWLLSATEHTHPDLGPQVLWAGDVDQDGQLDLLLRQAKQPLQEGDSTQNPEKAAAERWVLWLSSLAKPTEALSPAALWHAHPQPEP